jgi:hypothetical protein
MDRVSMQVATTRDLPDSADGWPRDQRARSLIRRDGDRLDVSQSYLFPEEIKEFKHRSHRWRAVTTKEIGVLYYAGVSTATPPKGIVSTDWAASFTRHGLNETTGGPLDGYFPPSGCHRVAELMAGAASLRLRGIEAIGETPCKVVEAKTRHGTYAMWIAESKGCLPLKVSYEIGPDDLHEYEDDRPFSEITIPTPGGRKHAGSTSSGILEEVTVAHIGDTFVPVAGKFTRTEWYTDVRLFAVNAYKRTEIELNPRFEGTDAFVTDLPEGAVLNNMTDQTSGVIYEWHAGKAVPGATEFRGSPAVGSWDDWSIYLQFLWTTVGVALFGAGAWMASPRQKRIPGQGRNRRTNPPAMSESQGA